MPDTETSNQQPATSNQQAALHAALAKAQGEFLPICKNRTATNFDPDGRPYQFRYADLEEVNRATRPALSVNGLSTTQFMRAGCLVTQLLHCDGGIIESETKLPAPDHYSHEKLYGAAISYYRRYDVTILLQVAADDDLDVSPTRLNHPGPTGSAGVPPASEVILTIADQLRSAGNHQQLAQIMSSLTIDQRKNFFPLYNEIAQTLKGSYNAAA